MVPGEPPVLHRSPEQATGRRQRPRRLVDLPPIVPIGLVISWFSPIWLHVPPGNYSMIRLAAVILIAESSWPA